MEGVTGVDRVVGWDWERDSRVASGVLGRVVGGLLRRVVGGLLGRVVGGSRTDQWRG